MLLVILGFFLGIMRVELLVKNKIFEKILVKKDFLEVDYVWLINSVRGFIEVEIK